MSNSCRYRSKQAQIAELKYGVQDWRFSKQPLAIISLVHVGSNMWCNRFVEIRSENLVSKSWCNIFSSYGSIFRMAKQAFFKYNENFLQWLLSVYVQKISLILFCFHREHFIHCFQFSNNVTSHRKLDGRAVCNTNGSGVQLQVPFKPKFAQASSVTALSYSIHCNSHCYTIDLKFLSSIHSISYLYSSIGSITTLEAQ